MSIRNNAVSRTVEARSVRNAEPGLRHEGIQTRRQCASVVSPCRHMNQKRGDSCGRRGHRPLFFVPYLTQCAKGDLCRAVLEQRHAPSLQTSTAPVAATGYGAASARRTDSVCDRDGQPYARDLLSLGRLHPRRAWRCEWPARFASRWATRSLGGVAARARGMCALSVFRAMQSAVSTVALALRVMVCVPQGRQKHTVPGSSVRNKTAG
jgi:hypothetical protein